MNLPHFHTINFQTFFSSHCHSPWTLLCFSVKSNIFSSSRTLPISEQPQTLLLLKSLSHFHWSFSDTADFLFLVWAIPWKLLTLIILSSPQKCAASHNPRCDKQSQFYWFTYRSKTQCFACPGSSIIVPNTKQFMAGSALKHGTLSPVNRISKWKYVF